MKLLKLINLKNISIYEQLCIEELLLRTTNDNYVIINSNIPNTNIVLGFSGKPHELINTELTLKHKVPVVRRYTGGGTVIVDNQTLFVSMIMNSNEIDCAPYPREIMKWTSDSVYTPLFKTLLKDGYNSFQLRENDYVWGDKKIGGNAQTIIKNRWCHHSSLLWKFDHKKMEYLKIPLKRPEYRANRDHSDFLIEIETICPGLSRQDFYLGIQNQLAQLFKEVQIIEIDHPIEFHEYHRKLKSKDLTFIPRTYYLTNEQIQHDPTN